MIIDIMSYVDRCKYTYIFYNSRNFPKEDLAKANEYFSSSFTESIRTMNSRAKKQQLDAFKINSLDGTKAKNAMEVVEGLSSSNWLEITMETIAKELNTIIEQTYNFNPFLEELQESQKYKGILQSGKASTAKVTKFFELILDTLNKYQKGYNRAFYSALIKIGVGLTGKENFSMERKYYNKAQTLTYQDAKDLEKIIQSLTNAVTLLEEQGKVTSKSFSHTITNIFSTVIGERVAKDIVARALEQGLNTVEGSLTKMGFKGTSGELVPTGTKSTEEKRTAKVDVINTGGLSLSVTLNGQTYNIEIGTNLSVKQYAGKNISHIGIVNQTPITRYLTGGSPERYFAFNILAHSGAYTWPNSFRVLRASLAASFVNEWLMGSGASIGNLGVDTAQFLFFNGKVYSMLTIINNICKEFMKSKSFELSNMPVNISFSKLDQEWSTEKSEEPNIEDAIIRSNLANQVLSKITISANFNTNILSKYAEI